MNAVKERKILDYLENLKSQNLENNYNIFLDTLTISELEVYLFVESKRAMTFIQELISSTENPITFKELENGINNGLVAEIIKNNTAFKSIIDFWNEFGSIDKPDNVIMDNIISKYNRNYKQITDLEINFFKNCYEL